MITDFHFSYAFVVHQQTIRYFSETFFWQILTDLVPRRLPSISVKSISFLSKSDYHTNLIKMRILALHF